MNMTRNLVAAFVICGMGQTALAGSLDPVVEPVVIVEEATSSSSGTAFVLALALLLSLPVLTD